MIKEVIVVEGRDDVTAVKKAVDAEVIAVGGFGINGKVINRIKEAQKRQGVIVLTDPDFAGEKIRRIIAKRVEGIKHAYIAREDGTKDGDIGVENATPEVIIRALTEAKANQKEKREEFSIQDGNGNQLLSRLNNYGITKEEFVEAMKKVDKKLSIGE